MEDLLLTKEERYWLLREVSDRWGRRVLPWHMEMAEKMARAQLAKVQPEVDRLEEEEEERNKILKNLGIL